MAYDTETGAVIGTTTLAVFPIPTAVRAWIEDVVVDGNARGSGAGAELTLAALRLADRLGAKTSTSLTPQPRGGQPPVPTARFRVADDELLPLRPGRPSVPAGD